MNCQWVMLFVTAHTLIVCHSSPAGEFAPQSDGIVEQWQTTNLHPWAFQPAPLALTALKPKAAAHNQLILYTFPFYQRSAGLLNYPFAYIQPGLQGPNPTAVGNVGNAIEMIKPPKIRDIEPTTPRSIESLQDPDAIPARLEQSDDSRADFKNDAKLLEAVGRINPDFVIEEIVPIPGRHIISVNSTKVTTSAKFLAAKQSKNSKYLAQKQKQNRKFQQQQTKKSSAAKLLQAPVSPKSNNVVVVEATGKTSTKGTIPQIPFGTYFLPYLAHAQTPNSKTSALILEPHSKAVAGNGGTAVSTPMSRALLKRGKPTNVYFNPESVAIAGVGGKAHAQADLELDLVN